jgi:hypothetical protein
VDRNSLARDRDQGQAVVNIVMRQVGSIKSRHQQGPCSVVLMLGNDDESCKEQNL